jgi:UDP-N-acetylmuramate dehydrogenase
VGNWIKNKDLTRFNTFGVKSVCRAYSSVISIQDVVTTLRTAERIPFVLGGGSNMLLPEYFDAWVIHNNIKGIRVLQQDENYALIEIGGGEDWHSFVLWAIERGFGGIENLSLIPGTVGAAPVQNIGAYGVELKEVFHSLDALDLQTGMVRTFYRKDCAFGYRYSRFKGADKGRFLIATVRLTLTTNDHKISTEYGAILSELEKMDIGTPSIKDVSKAVINIRSAKLPNPSDLGNSGSFFKNPIIGPDQLKLLQQMYGDMPYYTLNADQFKVPAGWLIEQCGWKGKRIGDVGCYEKQALVIVNYGKATSKEISSFAEGVRNSVYEKFGITLEAEVNML